MRTVLELAGGVALWAGQYRNPSRPAASSFISRACSIRLCVFHLCRLTCAETNHVPRVYSYLRSSKNKIKNRRVLCASRRYVTAAPPRVKIPGVALVGLVRALKSRAKLRRAASAAALAGESGVELRWHNISMHLASTKKASNSEGLRKKKKRRRRRRSATTARARTRRRARSSVPSAFSTA